MVVRQGARTTLPGIAAALPAAAEPDRLDVVFATWDFFAALRIRQLLGRIFTADEGQEESERIAVHAGGCASIQDRGLTVRNSRPGPSSA